MKHIHFQYFPQNVQMHPFILNRYQFIGITNTTINPTNNHYFPALKNTFIAFNIFWQSPNNEESKSYYIRLVFNLLL